VTCGPSCPRFRAILPLNPAVYALKPARDSSPFPHHSTLPATPGTAGPQPASPAAFAPDAAVGALARHSGSHPDPGDDDVEPTVHAAVSDTASCTPAGDPRLSPPAQTSPGTPNIFVSCPAAGPDPARRLNKGRLSPRAAPSSAPSASGGSLKRRPNAVRSSPDRRRIGSTKRPLVDHS
jgi:hypothetical protein